MLSLCMIVRDEEDVLGRCLDSVRGLVDEIVIADTGSKDSTRAIALRYTDKVYDFTWVDDFSAARNFAFSKASGDYLLWLDADDVIEDPALFREDITRLYAERPDVMMMPYNVLFDPFGRVILSYERERIVKRGLRFVGEIHEAIPPVGRVIHGRAAVSHRKTRPGEPGRNLRIIEKAISKRKTPEPRLCYYYARELSAVGRSPEAEGWYLRCAENPSAWSEIRVSSWVELSELYRSSGKPKESENALWQALSISQPRADLCCALGRIFLERGDLDAAEFWYALAPDQYKRARGGFVCADFGGYIPYLQLCVIFWRRGDKAAAEEFNRLAGACNPHGKEYLYNLEFFG